MEECAVNMVMNYGDNVCVEKKDYIMPNVAMFGKPNKRGDKNDREYKIFSNQKDANEFIKNTLGGKRPRYKHDRNNNLEGMDGIVTADDIMRRFPGINNKSLYRKYAVGLTDWVVIWRPSTIKN